METVYFLTGNRYKFQVSEEVLKNAKIRLRRKELEIPEIQSESVQAIVAFSARWASVRMKKPVFLTDVGVYIKALGGFPGPFVKYVNAWLCAKDYLRLMQGKKNRKAVFRECLAFCEPGREPVIFLGEARGVIAQKPGIKRSDSPINSIFIPAGQKKPASDVAEEVMLEFWKNHLASWGLLAEFLEKKYGRRF